MNTKNFTAHSAFTKTLSSIIVLLFLFTACSKDSDSPKPTDNKYLVSYEKIGSYLKSSIIILFTAAKQNYPDIEPLLDSTRYGVDLYKIEYNTVLNGESIVASGLVAIPDINKSFPILSFQNGTNTSHSNAPTENSSSTNYLLMALMAGNGYILIIPDYIGFGSSTQFVHPYFVKEPTARSVIDLTFAVREYLDHYSENATYNSTYFLAGYSQGGWATLATLSEIENNPTEGLSVKAASCGAGAYQLNTMTEYVLAQQVYAGPHYIPYYLYSHIQNNFLNADINDYLQEPYADMIPELFDGNYSNTEVNDHLSDSLALLLQPQFINNFETGGEYKSLRDDMALNSVSAWNTTTPIRFYHGTVDSLVPPSQSESMYNSFLELSTDANVEYYEIEGEGHNSGVYDWGIETVLWFNEILSQ